jgi:hypothetical protein
MAFLIEKTDGEIRVILRVDTAVKCGEDAYEAYLKSFADGQGDESLLKLEGEPTRFVMRKTINWAHKQKVRGKNMKLNVKDRELEVNVNLTTDTVQMHLSGIENPPGIDPKKQLVFKLEGGLVSNEIMNMLDENNVLGDLFTALQAARGGEVEVEVEKKD